jgi:hypothetical protein
MKSESGSSLAFEDYCQEEDKSEIDKSPDAKLLKKL